MTKNKLQIHSENILPIIKRWLYSDKDIFIRELISNACDAIHKVKILRDRGEAKASDEEFHISLTINKTNRTLTFSDTGIGMDAEEVQKYIAQIAFSGAESFIEKYQSHSEKDQFIGHFGLGFYSSFMVADRVEIQTLSYKEEAEPAFWSCDGSSEYLLEKGTKSARGTEICIYISQDSEEFLDEATVRSILQKYCSFLPYPILLNGQKINVKEPLWIKSPTACSEQEYLSFYRHLYPTLPEPLFWIHLNVDFPFHVQGILYFPKLNRNMDLEQSSIQLYCNRVFVSDHCKEIIPKYLSPLQGVIDSPDIPLNVSRSYLQMDKTVKQLSSHIAKKVADSLQHLYKSDREKYLSCWGDLSLIVKLGVAEDEKFYQKAKEFLVWKTLDGSWKTVEEYLEKNKENKVFYTNFEKQNTHIMDMYKSRGIEVLCAEGALDSYVFNQLEKKLSPVKFQRVDAAIDHLLDPTRENSLLGPDGKTEASKIAEFIRSKLGNEIPVEAKSLNTSTLPGFIVIEENHRRFRDYMRSLDPSHKNSLDQHTFVVNTNSPLISAIHNLEKSDPELSEQMVHQIYELALLSQKEIDQEKLSQFITRTSSIVEKLAMKIATD